jgi:hypothetical protein
MAEFGCEQHQWARRDGIREEIGRCIAAFQERCRRGDATEELIQPIALRLGRLSLSSETRDAVEIHLSNTQRYMRSRECGAAVYELRRLLKLIGGAY